MKRLIIHGGAGLSGPKNLPPERAAIARAVLHEALEAGYSILAQGGAALEAVIESVRIMEDADCFNAGCGSVLAQDGQAHMDASLMCGKTRAAGSVCNVTQVQNPILAAQLVKDETPHVLLCGEDV
jgi:L-asparaginase / beta-aspartyl-peptidase